MALLFMEGYEMFDDDAHLSLNDDARMVSKQPATGYCEAAIANTRYNYGKSLRLYQNTLSYIDYDIPTSNDTYYIGFAMNAPSITGNYPFCYLNVTPGDNSASSCQTTIYKAAGGLLSVYRGPGTALLGTTTAGILENTWHYVVLKVKLHDTTGTVELWLDGTKEIDLTSQDTLNVAGSTFISGFGFNGATAVGAHTYYDDIYIGDTSGTDMTDQVGECAIEALLPNANGNRNNFTASPAVANYLNVDEVATDDDTTYNYSDTVGNAELYGTASMTQQADNIYAVQAMSMLRKEVAGERTVNLICRSSTTEVDSAAFSVNPEYKFHVNIYENDPNGGINWTETTANAAEIGFEIAS